MKNNYFVVPDNIESYCKPVHHETGTSDSCQYKHPFIHMLRWRWI